MVPWYLSSQQSSFHKPRTAAVYYLNTVPLVWGFLHGPLKDTVQMLFASPARCSDWLASGEADIGIVPVASLLDQKLEIIRGTGIACDGPVRSILLITRKRPYDLEILAADWNSRSSVLLAQILLRELYGVSPRVVPHPPELESMLQVADGALVIGDPALRLDVERMPYQCLDLGALWKELTGLPMVFAVWAARPKAFNPEYEHMFLESYRFGQSSLEEIVQAEAPPRGIEPALAREYLTRHIVHILTDREYQGMSQFLAMAKKLIGKGLGAPVRRT